VRIALFWFIIKAVMVTVLYGFYDIGYHRIYNINIKESV
jgi:hypothetical protein